MSYTSQNVADSSGTFTTGNEPSFLGESATWWSEINHPSGEYERYLGISREMTEMVAKVSVSNKRQGQADIQYRIIHSRMTRLREKGGPADAMAKAASEATVESANSLLNSLEDWAVRQSSIPQIKRIQVSHFPISYQRYAARLTKQNGDSAYRHMLEISLLAEILSLERSDTKIQTPVRTILELCSQMSQEPINLLWPLLTAGAACLGEENRNWVRQLLDVFRPFYSQDLEVAVSSFDPTSSL
jgi:hypothetical protein